MENKRKTIILSAFAVLLSFSGLFTILLFKPSLTKDVTKGLGITVFSVKNLIILIVLYISIAIALRYIDKILHKVRIFETNKMVYNNLFFVKSFIILCTFWSAWLWLYYPGAGMNDTIANIMSFHNGIQPLIYQLIIYYGVNGLTGLTHNMTTAYAILVAAQIVIMSLVISWSANWLKKKGISHIFVNLFVAYYALMPAVADYSITLVKDTLFGICFMVLIPIIYDLIDTNGSIIKNKKFYCAFILSLLGINVFRSNGKYITFITVILLLIMKLNNKKYILSAFIVLSVAYIGLSIGEKNVIEGDYDFRESIGVPMAQIGAVLNEGGHISEQNKELLNNLVPLDIWKDSYRFSFSDPIKADAHCDNQWLNAHKKEFLQAWFSILKDNFGIYVKAYLCHTYGFWNISPLNILSIDYTQSFFVSVNNNTGDDSYCGQFCIANGLRNREIRPGTVGEQINTLIQSLFRVSLMMGAGIMFWICMGFMIELFIHRKYKMCNIFVPVILNWATMMIASPASFIYRYSFYLVLLLPLLFLITLMQMQCGEDSKMNDSGNHQNFM